MLNHSKYPETTLFMLMSIDGKISTGATDTYDVDADFPKITGLKEGLQGYYDLESETDFWCLISGKTMTKIGANSGKLHMVNVTGLHRAVYGVTDLTVKGVKLLVEQSDYVHFFVKDPSGLKKVHDGCRGKDLKHWTVHLLDGKFSNILGVSMNYKDPLSVLAILKTLGCDHLTVQTGGTINGAFVQAHALDHINVVMAPCLIGGADTPTLIDGVNPNKGLEHVNTFKLVKAKPMTGSYLQLCYDVL